MKSPNFEEEKKLWKQGYKFVVGLDESGRGPLAGPVVAAAVFIVRQISTIDQSMVLKIRDSKKLSEKQRNFYYTNLVNHENIRWGVGIVSEKVIDKINILEATKLAMQKACAHILENVSMGFLLIDGNFKINSKIVRQRLRQRLTLPDDNKQKSIIKGDEKVFSIAAAGIIAKVTRDRIMRKMHKKYPAYGFNRHKGYGTALHIKNLESFGPCKIHRKTFRPVGNVAKN